MISAAESPYSIEQTALSSGRISHDFYPTPAPLTQALLDICPQLPGLIFEPCAGNGAISDVLRQSERMVSDSDIQWELNCPKDATKREFWEYWADSMRRMPSIDCRSWATITNPPFNLGSEILPLAYEYSPWGCAFLLRLSYQEPTKDRANWLKTHADNLRYVIPINTRPVFRRDKTGTDSITVQWMVYQKSWSWQALGIKSPFQYLSGWK